MKIVTALSCETQATLNKLIMDGANGVSNKIWEIFHRDAKIKRTKLIKPMCCASQFILAQISKVCIEKCSTAFWHHAFKKQWTIEMKSIQFSFRSSKEFSANNKCDNTSELDTSVRNSNSFFCSFHLLFTHDIRNEVEERNTFFVQIKTKEFF